jgi:hypothetical protein
VYPGIPHPVVILPGSQVKWLADPGENQLNALEMQMEPFSGDYTLLDASVVRNPIQASLIRRQLTRSLGTLVPDIQDELRYAFDKVWGCDSENWVNVEAMSTMEHILSRAANRVIVGLPLCEQMRSFS